MKEFKEDVIGVGLVAGMVATVILTVVVFGGGL